MPHHTRRRLRVLLVDDDPCQILLVSTILERAFGGDIEILAMEDPIEARQWNESNVVDILITDLSMPRISGLDLLATTKRRNPCTQVFFITGHSSLDALMDALELGATDYLLKPVDPKVLVAIVAEARKRLCRWCKALGGTLAAAHRTGCQPICPHV